MAPVSRTVELGVLGGEETEVPEELKETCFLKLSLVVGFWGTVVPLAQGGQRKLLPFMRLARVVAV